MKNILAIQIKLIPVYRSVERYVFHWQVTWHFSLADNIEPFTKWQILDSSKPKEFADSNFKFDKNDQKYSGNPLEWNSLER